MNRGRTFTRMVKSLAIARGVPASAISYAQAQNWLDAPAVVTSLKAAVTATTTSDQAQGSPAAFDFAEYIRPQTILGKLAGLRRVPSRTRLIAAVAGSTAYWSGEAQPRPISRVTFEGETLEPLAVVALLVCTMELLRASSPSAESTLTRDLAAAAVAAMDLAFIDPSNAGSAGVKPASITNGVTPLTSTGSSLAQIDSDLDRMISALSTAGSDLELAAWVMRPRTALYLARLRGTGGALAHPGMTAKGGVLLGLPVVTSAHVPVEVGSPGDGDTSITLLDPSQILVADDDEGSVQMSDKGAVQMESEPGGGAQSLVSLWQSDSAALKAVRYANWKRCRDGMAQVLTVVQY